MICITCCINFFNIPGKHSQSALLYSRRITVCYMTLFFFRSTEEQFVNGDYWNTPPHSQLTQLQQIPHPVNSPKVQVMPAHNVSTLSDPDPLTTEGEDKDKFKCLYLLVETAVAVRQREKEQRDAQM